MTTQLLINQKFNIQSFKYSLLLGGVAFLLAVIFYQDYLAKHIWAPDDRVMVPMQSSRTHMSDNYYYYIVSKKAPLRTNVLAQPEEGQEFFYENSGLESVYSGSLLVAGVLDLVAKLVPVKWNLQVLLSLIIQLSFLFLALICVYRAMRGGIEVPLIQLFAFVLIWALLARGVIYGVFFGNIQYLFSTSPFYHPDFMRLVNPQISWAYALFYLSALIYYFSAKSQGKYAVLILLSLAFSFFSVPLVVAVGLGLGLYGLQILIKERRIDWSLVGLVLALLLSFIYARYQFQLFSSSIKGAELSTGEYLGLNLKLNYLWLLCFIPVFRVFLPAPLKSPLTWIFVASLFLGVIGESFKLGSRIWLRGAGVFAHLLIVYAIFECLRLMIPSTVKRSLFARYSFPVLVVLSFSGVCLALQVNYSGWQGYIERDKAEVLEWFRERAGPNDVIASSDLEDAYLLPLYTHSQPYVQLFDFSVLSYEQRLQRYFQVLNHSEETELRMKWISKYQVATRRKMVSYVAKNPDKRVNYDAYQAYAFYSALVYFPYSLRVQGMFSSAEKRQEFLSSWEQIAERAKGADLEKIDFWIFRSDWEPRDIQGYKLEFENSNYKVLSSVKSG